jgi:hypothetical protein
MLGDTYPVQECGPCARCTTASHHDSGALVQLVAIKSSKQKNVTCRFGKLLGIDSGQGCTLLRQESGPHVAGVVRPASNRSRMRASTDLVYTNPG